MIVKYKEVRRIMQLILLKGVDYLDLDHVWKHNDPIMRFD